MYKMLFMSIATATLLSCHISSDTDFNFTQSEDCKGNAIEWIQSHAWLPENFNVLSVSEESGFCETIIESDGKVLTIYAKDDFILVGDLFRDGQAITKRHLDKIKEGEFANIRPMLDDLVATTYTPIDRNINQQLYMVADPHCHYCQDAHSKIMELSERYGFTVNLIIYNAVSDVKESIDLACRDFLFEDFGYIESRGSDCEEGSRKVQAAAELMHSIGVKGVPTFILDNGTQVRGADFQKLEEEIIMSLERIETGQAS